MLAPDPLGGAKDAGGDKEQQPMTLDIMMPFYGRIDHFRQAVESVLGQTDEAWRLVVVDDAYPDESAGRWLTSLGDRRITYIRHAENVGINANFQMAIDLARADRLVIFGCDDIMLPRFVARVGEVASLYPDAALIHPGSRVIDVEGAVTRTLVDTMKRFYRPIVRGSIRLSGEKFATSITRGNWMNFPAIAWRRDLVSRIGFRAGWDVVQDLALALDVAMSGGDLIVDEEVVFEYRRHLESVSSSQAIDGRRFVEERRFFDTVAGEFDDLGWARAKRAARLHLSSRLNAASRLPSALARRDLRGIRTLIHHSVG